MFFVFFFQNIEKYFKKIKLSTWFAFNNTIPFKVPLKLQYCLFKLTVRLFYLPWWFIVLNLKKSFVTKFFVRHYKNSQNYEIKFENFKCLHHTINFAIIKHPFFVNFSFHINFHFTSFPWHQFSIFTAHSCLQYFCHILKGQCHEIFDLYFFFINRTHLVPW